MKIITRGEVTSKINLSTQFASKTAIEAIEKAGGKWTKISIPQQKIAEDSRRKGKKKEA